MTMLRNRSSFFAAACASLLSFPALAQSPHVFTVTAGPQITAPVSGRLLLFMKQGHGDKEVGAGEFSSSGQQTWIAAQEVHDLAPGASIRVDADTIAYPEPFSHAPSGAMEIQAVLDVDHSFNYGGRAAADWQSQVGAVGDGSQALVLNEHPAPSPREQAAAALQARPGIAEKFRLQSNVLTAFWGKPTFVQGWVILPPGYDPHASTTYPTAYWTHGFGGNMQYALMTGMQIRQRMEQKKMAPMIWVMLDESLPEGTHEFADSVNDGPWGTALTTEYIPALERAYRMDAKPNGRFLNGHSSGGWATLQLEVDYPQVFGGTWSTSPDPSDFHDFTGTDLYAPGANVYHGADGKPTPLVRMDGKVTATFEQFAKEEAVLGPYGGQITSFDWVFSPRSPSGAPEPMFDRVTGIVDPKVVQYWHDHYDLAYLTEKEWPAKHTELTGRIHLWVGTADTFYLDGAAHLFEARLKKLGAEPHFTYVPGASHFTVYTQGTDRFGLFDTISEQMYAVARPSAHWQPAP